jgi:hypothetical protein
MGNNETHFVVMRSNEVEVMGSIGSNVPLYVVLLQ